MRIGVIGCGGMGTTHYLSLKVLSEKEDDVEVVALSDCRKEFLDKAASYFPEAATYEYGMELLEKEQLDIILRHHNTESHKFPVQALEGRTVTDHHALSDAGFKYVIGGQSVF